MKKILLLLFIAEFSSAQNPLVKQWDYRFGGTDDEVFVCMQQTFDRGYIIGGYSYSNYSGDKTEPTQGDADYWIIKIDSLGHKEWDKRFGGSGGDYLTVLKQSSDGGYIMGGISYSPMSGDKSQNTWGDRDYWIVRTDASGNKIWDRDFGGSNGDILFCLQQTFDKGFLLGGYSNSGISGDKTEATKGGSDYWIVKIDSFGNMLWDKDFGGTGNNDMLQSLQQTSDTGYILGGYSDSGISGDKSQALHGTLPDYWIVKIDSLGVKQWDKDFGGTDYEDEFGNISQTSDNGYLIAGASHSNSSCNKTENNLGGVQSWVVKTDANGNYVWDKTLLTTGNDDIGFAIQSKDGCYEMANSTYADIGGNKTQNNWGYSSDYWIVKFCDTTHINSGIQDENSNVQLSIYPNPSSGSFTIQLLHGACDEGVSIDVVNTLEQNIFSSGGKISSDDFKKQIDLNDVARGVYFIEIKTASEFVRKKILITE